MATVGKTGICVLHYALNSMPYNTPPSVCARVRMRVGRKEEEERCELTVTPGSPLVRQENFRLGWNGWDANPCRRHTNIHIPAS